MVGIHQRLATAATILLPSLLFGSAAGFVVRQRVTFKNNNRRNLNASVDASKQQEAASASASSSSSTAPPPAFLMDTFLHSSPATAIADCDDVNRPPSLNILLRTLQQLTQGGSSTDIRGKFVDHRRLGSVASVAHEIGQQPVTAYALLTPFAAYCLGHGLARFVMLERERSAQSKQSHDPITIVVGQDPRTHGKRLADALARGAQDASSTSTEQQTVQVLYTGIATTPACAAFGRLFAGTVDASVMVTASHLPADRNGFKLFYNQGTCLSLAQIAHVGRLASQCAIKWYTQGTLPPASGENAVMCHAWVDYMPTYADSLKRAIQRQVMGNDDSAATDDNNNCLQGLTLVVNAGHGSGGFFAKVLQDLGANVEGSIGIEPDSNFPLGIPNPEYKPMIDATIAACQKVKADLGIMLDTDSDRCGFVVPTNKNDQKTGTTTAVQYDPLNRNRLIAMMGVILSQTHPGCAVVTDSVTSEGLSTFLQDNLGLTHVRYLKGYQNVIDKAKELTETGVMDAELAMETSGHGAMRENYYLDDGTYTAVKIVSLLAQQKQQQQQQDDGGAAAADASLLDLIADMEELDVIRELRFTVAGESLDLMRQTFDICALEIEELATTTATGGGGNDSSANKDDSDAIEQWSIDRDNLEGIRIRVGNGQFFMLRKSLHDPIISLQIEASSHTEAQRLVIDPLLHLFESQEQIKSRLDLSVLREF